mmetsp:Transcript_31044/g.87986  ORF Transcript_31044/g.87986 Transcript_31044/m.87986 type:complete len:227 (+) Transcript_31044:899-1579(+)
MRDSEPILSTGRIRQHRVMNSRTPCETVQAWASVLVLVDARTLAAASQAGRALREAFAQALRCLKSDVSGGQEPTRIPCINCTDTEVLPTGYTYRRSCQLPFHPPQLQEAVGCGCTERLPRACTTPGCCCCCTGLYDASGRLQALRRTDDAGAAGPILHMDSRMGNLVHECGPACTCSRLPLPAMCSNRISQVSFTAHMTSHVPAVSLPARLYTILLFPSVRNRLE